ncbi:MAG: class I SAM-dependent RNA methyltransferase [Spirochaetaceae bacterium]|jgi:23S rRNA (uracil1939-C5)-methyltransferase|nr:class I SAM-dependent RNA methyltransferase [Spirochaetaceae bacterium]
MFSELICTAETITSQGSALVRVTNACELEGKKYFVKNACPGDILLCKVTSPEKNSAEIVKILEASPDRVQAVCHFCSAANEGCGGCPLMHIAYNAQVRLKTDLLKNILLHGGIKNLPDISVEESSPFEYRNRIELHKIIAHNANPAKKRIRKLESAKENKPEFGFMAEKSNNIIPVNDCVVCDPVIRNALREKTIQAPPDKDRFTIYGRNNLLLCESEKDFGKFKFLDKDIKVSAPVFFQSNGDLLEKLISDIIKTAEQANTKLPAGDFYCGVGTFGVFLQDCFLNLDLFDQNKNAVSIARENVRSKTASFYALNDTAWVKITGSKKTYGFVTVDPGRSGLSSVMCNWLCESKPAVLCYVSCNPSALSRDSALLLAASYKLVSLKFYDFYPQTAHIESLAVFML